MSKKLSSIKAVHAYNCKKYNDIKTAMATVRRAIVLATGDLRCILEDTLRELCCELNTTGSDLKKSGDRFKKLIVNGSL